MSSGSAEVFETPSLQDKVSKVSRDEFQQMMEKAQKTIDTIGDDYETWANEDLARMHQVMKVLKSDEAQRGKHLQAVFRISHEMKGQGGSFGYPLVSDIAHSLCKFLDTADESQPKTVDVVEAHVQALNLIIKSRMAGDGGKVGDELLTGLLDAAEKVAG